VLLAGLLFVVACRPPALDLRGSGVRMEVRAEDHSRQLKRLRDLAPEEKNTPEARQEAIEAHRAFASERAAAMAAEHHVHLSVEAPLRLELTYTSLGEVRTKYILYGIASGVGWGLATGWLAHNPKLAVGLGTYELFEETAFWVAGAGLFGSYSAPVVLEAKVFQNAEKKPMWEETYYVLNARKKLKTLPPELRAKREVQIHCSMERALEKLFSDLDAMASPNTTQAKAP
jgi:hypothetical protein